MKLKRYMVFYTGVKDKTQFCGRCSFDGDLLDEEAFEIMERVIIEKEDLSNAVITNIVEIQRTKEK